MAAFGAGLLVLTVLAWLGYVWLTVGSIQCRDIPSYAEAESVYIEVPPDRVDGLVNFLRQFAADRSMTFGEFESSGMTSVELCNRTLDVAVTNPFNQTVFSVHMFRNADRDQSVYMEYSTPLKAGLRAHFREVPQSSSGEWDGRQRGRIRVLPRAGGGPRSRFPGVGLELTADCLVPESH